MTRRDEELLAAAREAQSLIVDAIARMTPAEVSGSAFDQPGMTDGAEIIAGYLAANEFGVAFDHLVYMLDETGILLSPSSIRFVEETAAAYPLPSPAAKWLVEKLARR